MHFNDMFIVFFSGLRGAIAFSLALGKETENGEVIFTTTLIIVLFTVLVMGGATVPLLDKLKIRLDASVVVSPDEYAMAEARLASSWLMTLDRRYLQPFFTRRRAGYGMATAADRLVRLDSMPGDNDEADDQSLINDIEGHIPELTEESLKKA